MVGVVFGIVEMESDGVHCREMGSVCRNAVRLWPFSVRSSCGAVRLPRISVIFAAGGSCGSRHLDDPPIRHVST